jgi:hypothetical protein
MENLFDAQQQIAQLHFRHSSDALSLRLHMLETMALLSSHHQHVTNPVLRHHIKVTFYHLQEVYKETDNTPVSFKKAKREVLETIQDYIFKANMLDTKTEYLPFIQPVQADQTGMQAVA